MEHFRTISGWKEKKEKKIIYRFKAKILMKISKNE